MEDMPLDEANHTPGCLALVMGVIGSPKIASHTPSTCDATS